MKFETKFNLSEMVYVISNNKIRLYKIAKVSVELGIHQKMEKEIKYFLNTGTEDNYKPEIFNEDVCFESKEELLKSLE